MTPEFVKFPHTPHLAWLGRDSVRGDKVLDPGECEALLGGEVVIEEKVDGANVGISFSEGMLSVQNRGGFIKQNAHPQFQPLWSWLALHQSCLQDHLGTSLILFGEWCFARHTVEYTALPDWFLAFDVYDRETGRFWSTARRDQLAAAIEILTVPELGRGHVTLNELIRVLETAQSTLGSPSIEGLYIRRDEGEWLTNRAKLVRAGFVQSIEEHWMSRPFERNKLRG